MLYAFVGERLRITDGSLKNEGSNQGFASSLPGLWAGAVATHFVFERVPTLTACCCAGIL